MSRQTILDQLIQARGIRPGDYAVFFASQEGLFHGGFEDSSGYVLVRDGRVYAYWVSSENGEPALTEWLSVPVEGDWLAQPEYLRAREKMKLRQEGNRG